MKMSLLNYILTTERIVIILAIAISYFALLIVYLFIRINNKRLFIAESTIINKAPILISYANLNGTIEFFNHASEDITGYTYDELKEKGLQLFCDNLTIDFIHTKITESSTLTYFFEFPIKRKDGTNKILSFSAFIISLPKGDGICIMASDITDQKNLETELLLAKETSEYANQAKDKFLSRMSHEMKTPMNAIIGMTEIAKNSSDDEKNLYCLEKIDIASKHLLNVINDVLDMSKIEANKLKLSFKEFDIGIMIQNITTMINFHIQQKNQRFSVNIDKDVPSCIFGDEFRLSQVIINLLSNASKFTDEKGEISLKVKKISTVNDINTIKVIVEDNGIGISKEQHKRLFNLFEQADEDTARKYGGMGLGLTISKRIIELMGGEIWIESEPDKGSKFIFTIEAKTGTSPSFNVLSEGVYTDNIKILFIDDSVEARDYFVHVMKIVDIKCDTASNAIEALQLIEKNKKKPYNLFFIDFHMPKITGIDLAKKIRTLTDNEPIIIMTSTSECQEVKDEAMNAGVNHFITKPFFQSKLFDCINEHFTTSVKNNIKKTIKYMSPTKTSVHNDTYKAINFNNSINSEEIDYDVYLPIIDVKAGLDKAMGNKALYFTLLHNFKGRSLSTELRDSINSNSFDKAEQTVCTLKTICLNLGFLKLADTLKNIEIEIKMKVYNEESKNFLDKNIDEVISNIAVLLEREGAYDH